MKKHRIDLLMVRNGFAESRSQAQRLIMAGEVLADGQPVFKPSQAFSGNVHIEIKEKPKYVSRGGYKLEKALIEFGLLDLQGKICVDVGASTGGFTDCLLQHRAERVYALDVGYGQLHDALRNSKKVVVMERTNVKDVHALPEPIDLVVVDASFISLKAILPVISLWNYRNHLHLIALVKPQFEAGRKEAARGKGVIRDEEIHRRVIAEVIEAAETTGFTHHGTTESPLQGARGNREFLIYLKRTQ